MSSAFDPDEVRTKLEKVLASKDNFYRSALASFKQFDKDQSGNLDLDETKRLVSRLCQNLMLPPVDEKTVVRLFNRYDFHGHSLLTLEEFQEMYYYLLCSIRDKFYPTKQLRINKRHFIARHTLSTPNISQYYKTIKKLGHGNFGEVFLVSPVTPPSSLSSPLLSSLTPPSLVCKTIHKDNSNIPVEQIEDEIKILKELDHPNIMKVYNIYDDHNNIYLITEYCSHGELLSVIADAYQQKKKLPIPFILNVTQQILSALTYIHKKRIIHKDLKPENILFLAGEENRLSILEMALQGRHEDYTVKVIDFGLSEMFSPSSPEYSCNSAGTALYMAPEVYQRQFNYKCDVWSCGVLLYMLLTNTLPFVGKTIEQVKGKVLYEEVFFSEDAKRQWPLIVDLIQRMLVKNPAHRWSAEECLKHPVFKNWDVKNQEKRDGKERRDSREGRERRDSRDGRGEDKTGWTGDMIRSMKSFMRQSTLHQALSNLLAHSTCLSFSKARKLRDMFVSFDKDKSGTLSSAELHLVLSEIGFSSWEISRVVQAMDMDDDHSVSYTEFVACLCEWRDAEINQVWNVFRQMDLDNDGKITTEEFLQVLLGEEAKQKLIQNKAEFNALVQQIDTNGDGNIDWDEFITFIKSEK